MKTYTDERPTLPEEREARKWRPRWRLVVVTTIALALVAAMVGFVATRDGDSDGDGDTRTDASVAPTTTAPAPSDSATTAPPETTAPPTERPSAADALQPFFAAATTMDEQLRAAATAINGTGPRWEAVTQEVADRVNAAELEPVAQAIPAGLPRDLLLAVMRVYTDLSSRRAAMQSFALAGPFGVSPIDPLAELANGHAAAERFDGDLVAARALAASLPPVTVAPPDSKAAAELLMVLEVVRLGNFGCNARGGGVMDELPTVVWFSDTYGAIEGTVHATLIDGQWVVEQEVC